MSVSADATYALAMKLAVVNFDKQSARRRAFQAKANKKYVFT